ncbi:MAG: hypothetical protein ACLUO9_05815 [Coprococcus comes]
MENLLDFIRSIQDVSAYADSREMLDMKMQKSLKNWIRAAYILWKENKILVK